MSRKQTLISLRKQIKITKDSIDRARNNIIESKFTTDSIRKYNKRLHELSLLNMKLRREEKYNKPEQYMDEISIPGNIFL